MNEIKNIFDISNEATRLERERCLKIVEKMKQIYKGDYDEYAVRWVCDEINSKIDSGE